MNSVPANFLEQYRSYRPDIKMARTSRDVTGSKNLVSENELSNLFQILRKPTPMCHIVRSGRIEQLGAGGKPSTRLPPGPS